MCSRDNCIIFILFLFLSLLFKNEAGGRSLLIKENMELEAQMKHHRMSAENILVSEDEDVIDCIDIHKQSAFDHPLLKNHTIQRRPSSFPSDMKGEEISERFQHVELKSVRCPNGKIPIMRSKNHNFIKMRSFRKFRDGYFNNSFALINGQSQHFAIQQTKEGKFYGVKASITVYSIPEVKTNQLSAAAIWLREEDNNDDFIMAGWVVDPNLYGDTKSRLGTAWNNGGSKLMCIDLVCPGFVQVSSDIHLGAVLEPVSTYNGPQYYISLLIFKDPKTKNWWLIYGDNYKPIGYWPNSLFNNLANEASKCDWGGKVVSPPDKPSPPMGSGHFPSEGFRKSAYFRQLQIVDADNVLRIPSPLFSKPDRPDCYPVGLAKYDGGDGTHFYYGGPGGCED